MTKKKLSQNILNTWQQQCKENDLEFRGFFSDLLDFLFSSKKASIAETKIYSDSKALFTQSNNNISKFIVYFFKQIPNVTIGVFIDFLYISISTICIFFLIFSKEIAFQGIRNILNRILNSENIDIAEQSFMDSLSANLLLDKSWAERLANIKTLSVPNYTGIDKFIQILNSTPFFAYIKFSNLIINFFPSSTNIAAGADYASRLMSKYVVNCFNIFSHSTNFESKIRTILIVNRFISMYIICSRIYNMIVSFIETNILNSSAIQNIKSVKISNGWIEKEMLNESNLLFRSYIDAIVSAPHKFLLNKAFKYTLTFFIPLINCLPLGSLAKYELSELIKINSIILLVNISLWFLNYIKMYRAYTYDGFYRTIDFYQGMKASTSNSISNVISTANSLFSNAFAVIKYAFFIQYIFYLLDIALFPLIIDILKTILKNIHKTKLNDFLDSLKTISLRWTTFQKNINLTNKSALLLEISHSSAVITDTACAYSNISFDSWSNFMMNLTFNDYIMKLTGYATIIDFIINSIQVTLITYFYLFIFLKLSILFAHSKLTNVKFINISLRNPLSDFYIRIYGITSYVIYIIWLPTIILFKPILSSLVINEINETGVFCEICLSLSAAMQMYYNANMEQIMRIISVLFGLIFTRIVKIMIRYDISAIFYKNNLQTLYNIGHEGIYRY